MHELASALPPWTVLPFAALLLCIAVLPLAAPRFWESHRNKGLVALALALPILVYLPAAHGEAGVHRPVSYTHLTLPTKA